MNGANSDPRKYVRLAADLRDQIRSRALPPGGALPTIADAATKYQVSRRTSARALRLLADEGLIWRVPGLGWYVRDWEPGDGASR